MRTRARRTAAPRGRYHHGDLKAALVEAALEIVRDRDVSSVSLREAARRAGVSAGAPYHHFRDKSLLLAEVAEQGFRLLIERLDRTLAAARRLPAEERLRHLGEAYIRFALGQPGHYRVMFSPELLTPEAEARVHPVAIESFQRLAAEVGAARPGTAPEEVLTVAVTIWSGCHGLASLMVDGILRRKDGFPMPPPEALLSAVAGQLATLVARPLSSGRARPRNRRHS